MLHLAAKKGHLAVLKYTLAHSDLNTKTRNKAGRTPLHYAFKSSRTIELLVSHGADISAKTDEGWSALGLVPKRHKLAAVQALGDTGPSSKPLVKDVSRQTPIQTVEKNEAQIEDPFLTHQ